MPEHQCLHETDLALMADRMKVMCDDLKEIKGVLLGNGKVGVKTQQELNKASIKRLYWIVGIICVPVLIMVVAKFIT